MPRMTEKDRLLAIEEYKQGGLASDIAARYDVSKVAFLALLRRRNIDRQSSEYVYRQWSGVSLGRKSFSANSARDCYWMGFLAADGGLSRYPRIVLNLGASDKEHLECFKHHMESSHKIQNNKNGTVGLSIASKSLSDSLRQFGLLGLKEERSPCKDLALNKHFLRGVIDADGHIKKIDARLINIEIGSSLWAANLLLDLAHEIGRTKATVRQHNGAFYVGFGNKTSRAILDYCQPLKNDHFLGRKWQG